MDQAAQKLAYVLTVASVILRQVRARALLDGLVRCVNTRVLLVTTASSARKHVAA